jgi:hypothetical protein
MPAKLPSPLVRHVIATLALAATCACHAAEVSWATFGATPAGTLVPGIIGAPDGVTYSDPATAAKFTDRRSYPGLASTMGLSDMELAGFELLAWEANGGSAAPAGGWESTRLVFDSGVTAVIAEFNEISGASDNPAVRFRTGSISGAAYNALFGTSVADKEVWSWLLVDLPPGIDARLPAFELRFAPVGGGVGLGEGTPNPDAFGVLSAVPEPSTVAMTLTGLFGLAALRRRPRQAIASGTPAA